MEQITLDFYLNCEKNLHIAIKALKQCANPSGAYDMDRMRHAENTIKNTAKTAQEALALIGEDFSNVEIEQ